MSKYEGPEFNVGDRVRTNKRAHRYPEPVEFIVTGFNPDPGNEFEGWGRGWYSGDPKGCGVRSAFLDLVTPAEVAP